MESFSLAHDKVWVVQYSPELVFRLELEKDKGGKYRLYFLSWKQIIPSDSSAVKENNLPFVSFANNWPDGRVKILGMYVPPELRGTDFSDIMLSRFFQMLEQSGLELGSTAQIKKPLLAAKLSKIWFIPERADMVARIIWTDKQNIPIVVIEENSREEWVSPKNVSSTRKNTFYHVVSTADQNSGRRVAIQTQYLPPWNVALREYVDKVTPNISWKVRLYPARVRKLLEVSKK